MVWQINLKRDKVCKIFQIKEDTHAPAADRMIHVYVPRALFKKITFEKEVDIQWPFKDNIMILKGKLFCLFRLHSDNLCMFSFLFYQ